MREDRETMRMRRGNMGGKTGSGEGDRKWGMMDAEMREDRQEMGMRTGNKGEKESSGGG